MFDLEKFGALLKANNLDDISHILEKDLINMSEKDKFIDQLKDMSCDKEILEAVKFEDSIDYRFNLVEEEALERGKEEEKLEMIKSMLKKNINYQDISYITGKSIEEIKEIENSIKE